MSIRNFRRLTHHHHHHHLHHAPHLIRPLLLALLVALVTITGCSSSGGAGLPVGDGGSVRTMPTSITAYGFYYMRGAVDPMKLNETERYASLAAKRNGLFGVQGARYSVTVKGDAKDSTITSQLGFGGDLVNMTLTSCDSLACPAGGSWVVATMDVPFVYNEGDGVEAAVTRNKAYTLEIPVPAGSTSGPQYVAIRAIDAVLRHRYGGAAGTYEGTAYFLQIAPRVYLKDVAGRSPNRRWTNATPSMTSKLTDGTVMFDVTVVLADGFVSAPLKSVELKSIDELLPK